MALVRHNFDRKGRTIFQEHMSIQHDSAVGFGTFTFGGKPTPVGTQDVLAIVARNAGATHIGIGGMSISGNEAYISLFYSQTSFASIAATVTIVWDIYWLVGSR